MRKNKVICGATKKNGELCQMAPAPGRSRCRFHGGAALAGLESPAWKHGKYSKAMPSRLLDRYEATVADPDLLSATSEIALMTARLEDLLKRADSGESSRIWGKLSEAVDEFEDKSAMGMPTSNEVARIRKLCDAGQQDWMLWKDVEELLEQRRRHLDYEMKRRVQMAAMVPIEEVISTAAALLNAVREEVDDLATFNRIAIAFGRIVGAGAPSSAQPR